MEERHKGHRSTVWLVSQALSGENNSEEVFVTSFQELCLLKPWFSSLCRSDYEYCK